MTGAGASSGRLVGRGRKQQQGESVGGAGASGSWAIGRLGGRSSSQAAVSGSGQSVGRVRV